MVHTYLIFVIFLPIFANFCQFTPHWKRQFFQFSPIFRVKSVKIYTRQKKFTRAPPMTNMRYARDVEFSLSCSHDKGKGRTQMTFVGDGAGGKD